MKQGPGFGPTEHLLTSVDLTKTRSSITAGLQAGYVYHFSRQNIFYIIARLLYGPFVRLSIT